MAHDVCAPRLLFAAPLLRVSPWAVLVSVMSLCACQGPSPESSAAAPHDDAGLDGTVDAEVDGVSDTLANPEANSPEADVADALAEQATPDACELALTADFDARDLLPQSAQPESQWYTDSLKGTWGPAAAQYPPVDAPVGCPEVDWKRERVLAVARKYVGLGYQHHHIPGWNPKSVWPDQEGSGLDCSNFTAWVYNYAIGTKFTSDVEEQADGASAPGRRLAADEPLEPGDLLFIYNADSTAIGHAVLYVDAGHIIDSTGPGVQVRSFAGWYQDRYSHARRVIE